MGLAMRVEWNASHCTMLFKLLLLLVLSSSLTMTRTATRRQGTYANIAIYMTTLIAILLQPHDQAARWQR